MAKAERELLQGFACPKCRLLVAARQEQLGEQARCPSCFSVIQLPSPSQSITVLEPHVVSEQTPAFAADLADTYTGSWLEPMPQAVAEEESASLPWHTLIPAALLGCALFGALLLTLKNTDIQASTPLAQVEAAPKEEVKPQAGVIYETQVLELFQAAHKVASVEELYAMVIPSPGLKEKMERYYQNHRLRIQAPSGVAAIEAVRELPGYQAARLLPHFGDEHVVYVTRNAEGRIVFDWEAYVQFCSPAWDSIEALPPSEVVRIRATRNLSEYYNNGFESAEWQAFELTHREEDRVYIGYAKRGSEACNQLFPSIGYSSDQHVTLQVRRAEGTFSKGQLVIEKVLADHWLVDFKE